MPPAWRPDGRPEPRGAVRVGEVFKVFVGFRVWSLGFWVLGFGFWVLDLGFGGSGFRVPPKP